MKLNKNCLFPHMLRREPWLPNRITKLIKSKIFKVPSHSGTMAFCRMPHSRMTLNKMTAVNGTINRMTLLSYAIHIMILSRMRLNKITFRNDTQQNDNKRMTHSKMTFRYDTYQNDDKRMTLSNMNDTQQNKTH